MKPRYFIVVLQIIAAVSLSWGLAACEKEESCSGIMCDASCRQSGYEWGVCLAPDLCACATSEAFRCTDGIDNDLDGYADCWDTECGFEGWSELSCGDGIDNDCDGLTDCYDMSDCIASPSCGGCDAAACRSGCVAAGYSGGDCISGSCICTNTCAVHSQCPADRICYHGECQDPWGKIYTFTVVNGQMSTKWPGDCAECIDVSCGDPDVYVIVQVDAQTYRTGYTDDTRFPVWNYSFDQAVYQTSTIYWEMYDEDPLDADDLFMNSTAPTPITVADIKNGGWSWSVADWCGENLTVLNMTIVPK